MNTIEKIEKFSELIKSDKPEWVDFLTEWCGPWKMIKPVLEAIKHKKGNKTIIR